MVGHARLLADRIGGRPREQRAVAPSNAGDTAHRGIMETFDREPREDDEAPGILQSAWRYRWVVVTAALLGALLGYVLEARQPTLYEGVSRLLVSTGGDGLAGDTPEVRQEPERFLRNQA